MTKAWRYSINHGPNGEQNYANVYDGEGGFVGNLRIDHAIRVVTTNNEVEELRYLQSEVDAGQAIVMSLLRDLRDYAAREINRAGAHNDSIWVRVADVLPEPPSGIAEYASCPTCIGTGWQGGNATFGSCEDCGGEGRIAQRVFT